MMRNFTKPNKNSKKKAAITCAGVIIILLLLYLSGIIFPVFELLSGELLAKGLMIVYGIVVFALIIGVIVALRSRLREIEGGEEDEAGKY